MTRIILTIVSLLLLWIFVSPSTGQPKELNIPDAGSLKSVTGVGATEAKAKEFARKNAAKEVKALMIKNDLTAFEPTEDFVVTHLLDGPGIAGKEMNFDDLKLQEWIVHFRTNWWQEVERQDNALTRRGFATRLLTGLVVVLLSGFGYLRLDRYTNYRYTTWLRVAGVGLVSVVLAAFWWIVQISG